MRKNIFKKLALLSTMLVSSVMFSGYTSVEGTGHPDEWDIDNTQFVYDYANVFTDSEEADLQKMCDEVGDELGMDMVIVSATDLGGMYERDYADDFYDYGGYSESGILYLIDLDHDGIWVSTCGLAMVYMDDYDIEDLLDAIWEEYVDYDYDESAEVFVKFVEDLVGDRQNDSDFEDLEEAWNDGGYDDYDDFWYTYSEDIKEAYEENAFTSLQNPFTSMLIAAVIALVAVLIMCISSSTRMTAGSDTYMKKGSFAILKRFDRFTHTTTRSYRVNTSSGSSGGGSRGGSSSHRSSSGRSHGGGGRRR